MAGVDKIDLSILITNIDTELNNGVPVNSITPAKHNTLLSDTLTTLAFFNAIKFNIIASGEPAAGEISLDGKEFDTTTRLRISKASAQSFEVSQAIANIADGTVLHVRDYNGNFGEFKVTGKTENGAFWDVNVTPNAANPNYTPSGLQGHLTIFPAGDSANIMNSDLVANDDRSQDLDGNTLSFIGGFVELINTKIFIKNLRDLGNVSGVWDVDLLGGVDSMQAVVTGNVTLNFTNLRIGSGFINVTIGGAGGHTIGFGDKVELKDGATPQELTTTAAAKDRIFWTCDGAKVQVDIVKDLQ